MRSSWLFRLAVCGVVGLGLAASGLAVHRDLDFILWASHFVADGHLNVYQAVYEGPHQAALQGLTYPPLTYLYFGTLIWVGKLLGLFAYAEWNTPMVLKGRDYFFIRVSYVPYWLLIAWTCRRFAERFIFPDSPERESMGRLVFLVGLTSPVLLFVAFVFGQFDLLPSSMLFLGVYLISTRRLFLGVLAVFVGVWLKNFPILFLGVAAPVLVVEYGWKRTAAALAMGVGLTSLWMRAFRSPGFSNSYLKFQHQQYDVLVWVGQDGLRATMGVYLLLAVVFLAVGLVLFRNRLVTWERLVLLYSWAFIVLLAPRFWMPQYMSWVAPAFVLFLVLWLRLESPVVPGFYLALNGLYLLSTAVIFPHNVDVNMFHKLHRAGMPGLAEFLRLDGLRNEVWTSMSMLLYLVVALIAVRMFFWERVKKALEPTVVWSPLRQLQWTSALSVVAFMAFIGLHLVNIWVARGRL
ncbi:hypothetical protein [Pyxidicoccus sp. MSG2]|uniref:hypothetical protein n=1 Tax=Pyxidicoccus sp. MSG2 TaxID=2996790 RepID=UPI0022710BBF|nr:hypothetical protein [Pyxidicoccus sp. MSG2]MCY1022016.1 hypothetical protein [Pyxidicoccus sp. MSG2]